MIRPTTVMAYVLAGLLLVLTGCTASPGQGVHAGGRSPVGSPMAAQPSGASHGKGVPTVDSTARPIEPIPPTTRPGIVDPPPGSGLARYLDQRISWRPCGIQDAASKLCATVLAPLDYRHPDAKAITLAIARRPSAAPRPKGMIFTNPGGPGASGVDFLDFFNAHGLGQSYDIVSWDPRGSGRSTPVACFTDRQMEDFIASDYSPENAAQTQQLIDLDTEFGRACLARSGGLLEHISTQDTVRDLDLLRRLLGQKRLNYFGFSAGTSIGAMYATMFPHRVGRMVLDGATSIGGASRVSQTDSFNRTLGNFAAWCARQGCRLGDTKSHVEQTITTFLQGLDRKTIPGGRRDLTQALATSGLIFALYSPASSWPVMLDGLEKAIYFDNGTELMTWADAYYQRADNGQFSQFNAAFPAIRCLDERDHGVAGELQSWRKDEKRAPVLGPFIGPDLTCATWPVPATGDTSHKISYSGRPPVVILGTTGDPATPYEDARQMHKALVSSRLITLVGDGHLAFDQSACVQAKVLGYFVGGQVPNDSTCH